MDCTCFNNQHFTMAAKSKTKIDLKWRKSLDVGSKCEYKSKSDNKWIPAIISRIFRDETNKEWIKINYGNPKRKKEMKRFAKCIRPISMQKATKQNNKKRSLDNENVNEMNQKDKMNKKKAFKCKEKGCNQSFDKKSLLITHGAVHSKAKPFECEKCGKSYKLKGDLHAHTEAVHEKVINYKCEWDGCDWGFYTKTKLTLHMRTHTGEKPFECDSCGRSFGRKGSRDNHSRKCYNKSCQRRSNFNI